MHTTPDKKRTAILRVLSQSADPIGAGEISTRLLSEGLSTNERTIRHHLQLMEREGLLLRKGGRRHLTDLGVRELEESGVAGRLGRALAQIEDLACAISFDPETRRGQIAVDLVLVPRALAASAAALAMPGFLSCPGPAALVGCFQPGETIGRITIPRDTVGLATVSLVTFASLLIGRAIPFSILFGGILEVQDGRPSRFVEVIHYRETSVDPLGLFLAGGMVDAREIATHGRGRVAAVFAEAPAVSQPELERLGELMRAGGLGGIADLCPPDSESAGIHVPHERIGVILQSNLNPFSALSRTAIPFEVRTIAGAAPYSALFPCSELMERLNARR